MRHIKKGITVPTRAEMARAIQALVEDKDADGGIGQPVAEMVAQYLDAIYAALHRPSANRIELAAFALHLYRKGQLAKDYGQDFADAPTLRYAEHSTRDIREAEVRVVVDSLQATIALQQD